MAGPAASFEDHLAREIIHSERMRMAILAGLLAAMVVLFFLLYALFRESYFRYFLPPRARISIFLVIAALICYELAIRQLIGGWLRRGKSVPGALRYLNAIVETSAPSVVILLVAREIDPVYVLQSSVGFLYGIFIVLSTLRLDFRLSVFTGLVAAGEYVALCHAYLGAGGGAAAGTPFEAPPYYLAKGAALLVAGFAAGFVAHQLKRRVGNAFRAQQERQRIVSAFGQQVSPEIVEELLRGGPGLASRRAFVCILFMDIRNFTPMVEKMGPEAIVALQNSVFSVGIEVVNRHRGVINQFLGDGFMATFGAPVSGGEDCRNALAAARELVARLPMRIGIGLHAGEVVAGNVGSEQRQQYSVTGDVVILASRIEQLNKEYDSCILSSREVLAAGGELEGGHRSLGPVLVKGRNQPIEIYKLA